MSAVRSYNFVVLGDAWPAICCACSSVPPVRQIRRDARRPERVAARRRRQTRRRRTALDHRQHHAPRQRPAAQAPRPVDALKQRRLRLLDPAGGQIRVDGGLGPVMGRHVVPLAPLLLQPKPPPSPLQEVVLTTHPHDRAHPREAVHHHAQQRPVTKTHQRPRVDPVEQRPRLGRRQHRRRPLGHHVLRAPHRRGRIHRQHMVDDEPVAQHPDGGQVLLDRRRRPRMRTDIGRHVQRGDSRASPGHEPHTTTGTAPPLAHTPRASGHWRLAPRRTPGTARRPPDPRPRSPPAAPRAADPARATGGRATAGTRASLIPNSPPPPRALRTARRSWFSACASATSFTTASCAPAYRTSIRSRSTTTPAGRPDRRPASASTGTVTRMPVSRAFRSSVIRCSRRCASPRNSVPSRYVRSSRSSLVRGSVRAYPVRSAPNVCISCAARARETPNSCSMSRRVSSSRSRASSCRMASGMASSHCGLAGTGRAFRLQLLLRMRVAEEVGHARCSLQVSRRSYRMQVSRRRGLNAHKGRYGILTGRLGNETNAENGDRRESRKRRPESVLESLRSWLGANIAGRLPDSTPARGWRPAAPSRGRP